MALRRLTQTGRKLTKSDIVILEKKLKNKLPVPYREFLLQHNGGRPEPRYIRGEVLHYFYSVDAGDDIHDLWAHCKLLKPDLPADVIPIAADTFGNSVCLVLKGKKRGKVYFWDHEGASEKIDPRVEFPWLDLGDDYEFKGDDWPGHPDLTLIADSFAKFLDSFRDFDDEEAQATPAKATPKPSKARPATKQPGQKPRKSPKA
jgi:hypothetical protein